MQNNSKIIIVGKPDDEIIRRNVKSVSLIEQDGTEVVILDDKDCDFLPLGETPIRIVALPRFVEPYYPKPKHSRKGHERDYKYHK